MPKKSKRWVERKATVESIVISDMSLYCLLNEKFIEQLKKMGEEKKIKMHAVSLILMGEEKNKDKPILIPVIIGHSSKEDSLNKKLTVNAQNQEVLKDLIEILKNM